MKTAAIFLALCLLAAPAWAAGGISLEGFDLGQSVEACAKMAEQKGLRLYFDDQQEGGRLNRAYAGRLMGMDNADLSLIFKDGQVTMVTVSLEDNSPEGRQFVVDKYKELDAEYRKLGAEEAEAILPGLTDWVMADRLLSLFKAGDDSKLVVSVTSRGNVE